MNIKITYNWLCEYLDTDADPYELQKYLSLCGPSIETVEKVDNDYVLDIEVTSNRVDMASVFGVAQEAQAILPQFGKKAVLKHNPLETYSFKSLDQTNNSMPLTIEPFDQKLCSRFTAIVLSGVQIGPAPELIKKRLNMCGIQSINNVVDISNYLMLGLGQPTHMFDYDKIAGHTMKLREGQKGEKLTTLDGRDMTLPGGDIVIEDGSGKLIDLCGIMGGLNSAISSNTKNILFFVQTYSKTKIRRTSMTTGQRTVAATYFEKGLDEERVEPTLVYGLKLLQEYTNAQVSSQLYDIYKKPYTSTSIKVSEKDIARSIGVEIEASKITDILRRLGFGVQSNGKSLMITVPSFRKDDVEKKEDIVEEVARVYGYQNLPNAIAPVTPIKQPKDIDLLLELQKKIKYFFKYRGFHEIMNYSMISKDTIEKLDGKPEEHLVLANTISEEIKYLRTSLMQSLVKNIADNQGKKESLNLFEIAKVYHPRNGDLPDEKLKLGIVSTTTFSELKGEIELLLKHLNIGYHYETSNNQVLSDNMQAELILFDHSGVIGKLKPLYQDRFSIHQDVYLAELDFNQLILRYKPLPAYRAPSQYAVVKLDLTLPLTPSKKYQEMERTAYDSSTLLRDMQVVDSYKNNITVRFYFADLTKNLSEQEAKKELEKIKSKL